MCIDDNEGIIHLFSHKHLFSGLLIRITLTGWSNLAPISHANMPM